LGFFGHDERRSRINRASEFRLGLGFVNRRVGGRINNDIRMDFPYCLTNTRRFG
jgi:hypothetical protein